MRCRLTCYERGRSTGKPFTLGVTVLNPRSLIFIIPATLISLRFANLIDGGPFALHFTVDRDLVAYHPRTLAWNRIGHEPLTCTKCGYDLRGSLDSATCPECGEAFDWLDD